MRLEDQTSLKDLFKMADNWSSLPSSSLSEQQIALINLKNVVNASTLYDEKNGGRIACCFICITGA